MPQFRGADVQLAHAHAWEVAQIRAMDLVSTHLGSDSMLNPLSKDCSLHSRCERSAGTLKLTFALLTGQQDDQEALVMVIHYGPEFSQN